MSSKDLIFGRFTAELNDIKYAKEKSIVFNTLIGYGHFAVVYSAEYRSKRVAIKATFRDRCSDKAFKQELDVLMVLKTNPNKNVVQIQEIMDNSDKSQIWIIMTWIDGQDMNQIMAQKKIPFPEDVAKDYFIQMTEGLKFLHCLGIVHRDIKPHNILIGKNGTDGQKVIKYIDFGFAKLASVVDNKAICLSHKGSQIYMAPELMSDKSYHKYDAFKTDIYSLAIVLYEMLFYDLPFATADMGWDHNERNELMIALKENLIIKYPEKSSVSESAKDLIESMICKESDKRFNIQQILDSEWLKK